MRMRMLATGCLPAGPGAVPGLAAPLCWAFTCLFPLRVAELQGVSHVPLCASHPISLLCAGQDGAEHRAALWSFS